MHTRTCTSTNIICQLRRPILKYAESFVKIWLDLAEIYASALWEEIHVTKSAKDNIVQGSGELLLCLSDDTTPHSIMVTGPTTSAHQFGWITCMLMSRNSLNTPDNNTLDNSCYYCWLLTMSASPLINLFKLNSLNILNSCFGQPLQILSAVLGSLFEYPHVRRGIL